MVMRRKKADKCGKRSALVLKNELKCFDMVGSHGKNGGQQVWEKCLIWKCKEDRGKGRDTVLERKVLDIRGACVCVQDSREQCNMHWVQSTTANLPVQVYNNSSFCGNCPHDLEVEYIYLTTCLSPSEGFMPERASPSGSQETFWDEVASP